MSVTPVASAPAAGVKSPSFWIHLFNTIVPAIAQALAASGLAPLMLAGELVTTIWGLISGILGATGVGAAVPAHA